MNTLKWICFALVCFDTIRDIVKKANRLDGLVRFIDLCIVIAARVFVLYGAAVYWLLI